MKRSFKPWLTCWSLLLVCIVRLAFAAENQKPVFTGTLVDVTCATDPKRNLDKLRSEHSRKCLLMPVCAESGYALLTDHDEVFQFDTNGNTIARRLIQKNPGNQNWRVSVEGVLEEGHLSVRRIKLHANRVNAPSQN